MAAGASMASRARRTSMTAAPALTGDLFSPQESGSGGSQQVKMGTDEMVLSMHFENVDLECPFSSDYSYPTATSAAVGKELRRIVSSGEFRSGARPGVPEAGLVTKLCIAGGSRMTHAYVCAVVELLQSQDPADAEFAESLRSCPIALYLLPTGGEASDNVLAEYIGRADGWYSRHILNTLSSQVPAYRTYPHQFASV